MSTLLQDLHYAVRSFSATPGFTLAAILSLAIGIGANTAIFTVANALLIRPLSYTDADRLVILWNRSPGLGITEDWFSTAQYFDIRNGHQGFEDVAIAIGANFTLTGDGNPERVGTIPSLPTCCRCWARARKSGGSSGRKAIDPASPARRCSRMAPGCGGTAEIPARSAGR
jgi:hypothetical protein